MHPGMDCTPFAEEQHSKAKSSSMCSKCPPTAPYSGPVLFRGDWYVYARLSARHFSITKVHVWLGGGGCSNDQKRCPESRPRVSRLLVLDCTVFTFDLASENKGVANASSTRHLGAYSRCLG